MNIEKLTIIDLAFMITGGIELAIIGSWHWSISTLILLLSGGYFGYKFNKRWVSKI